MLEHSIFVLLFMTLFYLFMLRSSFGKCFRKEKKEKASQPLACSSSAWWPFGQGPAP
jgi:hypothetical protein